MLNNMSTIETIKLLMPIIIVQLGLMILCLIVLKKSEVKYLPKWGWALIIIFGEILGPVIFLLAGRKKD